MYLILEAEQGKAAPVTTQVLLRRPFGNGRKQPVIRSLTKWFLGATLLFRRTIILEEKAFPRTFNKCYFIGRVITEKGKTILRMFRASGVSQRPLAPSPVVHLRRYRREAGRAFPEGTGGGVSLPGQGR